ncbi:MAG: hypothetical protein ACRDOL_29155 [Streptosporangiaceae bacterium]
MDAPAAAAGTALAGLFEDRTAAARPPCPFWPYEAWTVTAGRARSEGS